jgi:hypothetical protein
MILSWETLFYSVILRLRSSSPTFYSPSYMLVSPRGQATLIIEIIEDKKKLVIFARILALRAYLARISCYSAYIRCPCAFLGISVVYAHLLCILRAYANYI